MRFVRSRTILSSAALGLALAAAAAPAHGQQADEQAVIAAVQRLFDAMRARDTAAMRSVLTAEARLVGQVTREGRTSIQVTPVSQFVTAIASISDPAELIERVYEPKVDIDGDLASYWAFYTLHLGDRFIHCGVDAAHLFRTADGWKIASLADTRRTTSCDPPAGSRRP
jgi:hypothetical protein